MRSVNLLFGKGESTQLVYWAMQSWILTYETIYRTSLEIRILDKAQFKKNVYSATAITEGRQKPNFRHVQHEKSPELMGDT